MAGGSDDEERQSRAWAPIDPAAPPPPTPASAPSAPLGTPASQAPPPPPPPPGQAPWAMPPPPGSGYPPQLAKAGDARTGPLPMHPMSVGDILDGAFKLFKANARTLLLIVAAITVPLQLVTAFLVRDQLQTGVLDILSDPTLAEQASTPDFGGVATTGMAALLALFVTPFVAGAVSRVVAASYLGHSISVGDALRVTMRRFGALLVAFVLVHLLELVGFVACILPGLLLMALFTVVAPAIAIEEIGPVEAMRRSWRLVRPRLWPVLGISLLAGMIAAFISNVLGAVPSVIATLFGGTFAWLLIAIGGILSEMVAAPLVSIVATLVYFDARIRQEGFDLQVMARDIGRGGSGS